MRLKVLLTSNIPSPYFVNYADELGKYVDLTVVFELSFASDRDVSWKSEINNRNFVCHILNAKRTGPETGLSFKILKFLKDKTYDRIIIANPATPTGIISLLYCRMHRIPFIIQSEGGFQGNGRGLKEKLKKFLMEKADMFLTGMGGANDYFLMYGATIDKLRPYPFSSSYQTDIDKFVLTESEKKKAKNELNVRQKYMLLFVGQFIYRKGVDILLRAYENLGDDVCLFLVGGKPTDEYRTIIKNLKLKNIFFIDFLSKKELRKYYQAADIFVMTTREDTWGLVINEAMEHSLPIITTNKCIAGLSLIENSINGFIVEPTNVKDVHDKIAYILRNDDLRHKMSFNNLNKIKYYTLENMALVIYNHIK